MSTQLISQMSLLGANVIEIVGESVREFDARMNRDYPEIYIEAKKAIAPTERQVKLCDDLVDCGASFELKEPHKDSMYAADCFIKDNYALLRNPLVDSVRYNEQKRTDRVVEITGLPPRADAEFYKRNEPSDYGVPNH